MKRQKRKMKDHLKIMAAIINTMFRPLIMKIYRFIYEKVDFILLVVRTLRLPLIIISLLFSIVLFLVF